MERLIQEDLTNPWQMLVACILLNRTRGNQVRPVLDALFHRWPTPERMIGATFEKDLVQTLRPLGLQNQKARALQAMSVAWVAGERRPEMLPGVGPYALESWAIFVEGNIDIEPGDLKLRAYVEKRREERMDRS